MNQHLHLGRVAKAALAISIFWFYQLATATPLAPNEILGEAVYAPFPVSIAVDGDIQDWAGVPFQTVDRGPSKSSDPLENGSFDFSVAADNEHVFVLMMMKDKNIVAGKHGADFWNEDSLEFYFNFSGDLVRSSYADQIFQININATNIGITDPKKMSITGGGSSAAGVRALAFRTSDGWGFEASVPLQKPPVHGLEAGFQAQANGATKLDRDVKLIWSNADLADNSWQNPNLFGRVLFFEIGQTQIPIPSVQKVPEKKTAATEKESLPNMPAASIKVNQNGFLPNTSKGAVLVSDGESPLEWTLLDANNQKVLSGKTNPQGLDLASGDLVHWIDFSSWNFPGAGYRLVAGDQSSFPFSIASDVYKGLTIDAQRYFYLNRSGIDLSRANAGKWARGAGHLSDSKVTCYEGKDDSGKNWPSCNYVLDASKGWYDAGDYGKYVVNGGISVWTLLNAYERNPSAFHDQSMNIPEGGNGIPDLLDEVRWQMEFMIGMQIPNGQPYAGMAHHKLHGLRWDGMPALPPEESDSRFLFPPSTAATLNLAAAAAQCARVWKSVDSEFSGRCLNAAKTAWDAARANPSMYAAQFSALGGGGYGDSNVEDELYWAAAELYLTTGEKNYQQFYLQSQFYGSAEGMGWPGTAPLGTISLAVVGKDQAAQKNIVSFASNTLEWMKDPENGYRSPLSPRGYNWGSNSDVLNRGIMLGLAFDFSQETQFLNGASDCMNYILGQNPMTFSYVSGYGTNSLAHPHHRFWGNNPDSGFPPPPPGVLSGGPNGNPSDPSATKFGVVGKPPAKSYVDDIGSYSTNEVAINWNAPLVWVASFLDQAGAISN